MAEKNIFGLILLAVTTVIAFSISLGLVPVSGVVWSTPNSAFNVTQPVLRLNWTDTTSNGWYRGNITITANQSSCNLTLKVINSTTETWLKRNYSQSYPASHPFQNLVCVQGIPLFVTNESGDYNNTYEYLNGTSEYNTTNFTLMVKYFECYPGRYYTDRFSIQNYSSSEYANLTIYLDIPISMHNTLDNTTGIASFDGIIPVNGTSAYHSFFFNATNSSAPESGMPNATGVVINLTSGSDVDMFLFDSSGNLLAKSINKTHNYESMMVNGYLPSSPDMWEIRVFGNSTSTISYDGNLMFTTLAVEDTSGSALDAIDFGSVNVSENVTSNAVVANRGDLTLSNVNEYIDVYAVKRFTGSGSNNFTFIVPSSSITKRVKVALNWTGVSNYSFNLYNQVGELVANSSGKHGYANVSGATQEEYCETTNIGSTTKYWTIEVLNNTNHTDFYNVTAYTHFTPSDWINTNFTTKTFNGTNRTNDNNNKEGIYVNLTVPATAVNGSYESYVKYLDDRGAGVTVKLTAVVATPMLVVNDTMESDTYTIIENYGTDLTRSFYFNISNPGGHDLTLNITDSDKRLNCTSGSCNSGDNASFSYPDVQISVPAGSSTMFRVNATFNKTMLTGLYTGWVKLIGTNSSANMTSHPYENFTANLRLNLTNEIDVKLDFMSSDHQNKVTNGTSAENITIRAHLYYKNGTEVKEGSSANVLHGLSNFTAVWLQEGNLTIATSRIPSGIGSLSFYNATSLTVPTAPYCEGDNCPSSVWNGGYGYYIDATVPANTPGGRYIVSLNLTYDRSNYSYLVGQSLFNKSLFIDNTGLHMSTSNASSLSISNSSKYAYYVNVSNYGVRAASSATIQFSESCSGYSVSTSTANVIGNGCTGVSRTGGTYTFSLGAFNSSCMFIWNISAENTAASACTGNILGGGEKWFDASAINVSITVTKSSDTVSTPTGGTTTGGTTTTTVPAADLSFTEAPTLVVVKQNSTNTTSVQVKNTGDASQTINFTIEGIDSDWWSTNSTSATLASGVSAGFRVTFTVGNVDIKDYSPSFKVTSPNKTVTSAFTLRVLPNEENETVIADKLTIYRSSILQLGATINETKAQGINVTIAEGSFNALMALLDNAEGYADTGDYFNAYQLFDDMDTQIADVQSELDAAKTRHAEQATFNLIIIAAVVAIIAVAAVLIYLFWPTKSTYKPGKGYSYRKGMEKKLGKEQLKSAVGKTKEKTMDFASKVKTKIKREKKKDYVEVK